MELELLTPRDELVIDEDMTLTYVLRNTSNAPITVLDPQMNDDWPALRVTQLGGGPTEQFGPMEIPSRHSDEYTSSLGNEEMELAPGQEHRVEAKLVDRAEFPGPGRYELTAVYEVDGQPVTSKPRSLRLHPARLVSMHAAPSHAGGGAYRTLVWCTTTPNGAVIEATGTHYDGEHADKTWSKRLVELGSPARAMASVSANKLSYGRQWVVWLQGEELHGLYHRTGKILFAPARLGKVDGGQIVESVLLDLDGNDGSQPGAADVVFARGSGTRAQLAVERIQPNGSVQAGPRFSMPSGDFHAAHAFMLSDFTRRAMVIVQNGHQVSAGWAEWTRAGAGGNAVQVAEEFDGKALASGATLREDDGAVGVVLLQGRDGLLAQPWRLPRSGKAFAGDPVAIADSADWKIKRAFVQPNSQAHFMAAVELTDGSWRLMHHEGRATTVDLSDRDVLGVVWLAEGTPALLTNRENAGNSLQPIAPF